MDLQLKDKVALVLASSKGLGLACAKILFGEGAQVIICSRSEANLKDAKEEIEKEPSLKEHNEVKYYIVNLLEGNEIKSLVSNVEAEYGRIDILVHNAGGPPSGPISEISKEQWSASIDLNLLSFVTATNLVLPLMKKQRKGRIIALTSVSVKQPLENLVLSNTMRLGVVGFAKTLANEYGKYGILVNVVCPGPTLTDRMQEIIDASVERTGQSEEEVKKQWTEQIPLGRMGNPEDLANLVAFLASEKASYITGTVIQVDGGFVKAPF